MADRGAEIDGPLIHAGLWRALRLILAGGLGASLLVFGLGRAAIHWQLSDSGAVVQKVEADARRQFGRQADLLQRLAETLARAREVEAGLAGPDVASRLFTVIAAAVAQGPADEGAVTIHDVGGRPIAWTGRPSEIPDDRVLASRDVFVVSSALGLRLVAVEPVVSADAERRRIGTVTAERRLSFPGAPRATDTYVVQTAYGPVTFSRTFADEVRTEAKQALVLRSPSGVALLQASVPVSAAAETRVRWAAAADAVTLGLLAITVLLTASALTFARRGMRDATRAAWTTGAILVLLIGARLLVWGATPPTAWASDTVRSWSVYSSRLWSWLHRSPLDLLITGLLLAAATIALVDPVRRWALARRGSRRAFPADGGTTLRLLARQLVAGGVLLLLQVGVLLQVQDTAQNSSLNLLRLTLLPWETPRLALVVGLVLVQAVAFWAAVLACRLAVAVVRWDRQSAMRWLLPVCWTLPALSAPLWLGAWRHAEVPALPLGLFAVGVAAVAWYTRRGIPSLRHGSEAQRLGLLLMALLVPAWLLYPALVEEAERAKRALIQGQYAQQVRSHPTDLFNALTHVQQQIDAYQGLEGLVQASATRTGPAGTEPAFTVWGRTDLEQERLTSAIELYGADGTLVSRFALNFPEAEVVPPQYRDRPGTCSWEVFGEVQPFGADERRMLHAERALCVKAGGRQTVVGAIVAHVMLDYSALPFISSQSPYYEFIRAPRATPENTAGGDVALTVFGWGRLPIYTSSRQSWLLTDAVFERAYRSREPFWTTLVRGDTTDRVYVTNDRNGIYAVGYPVLTAFNHLVHLGELTSLTAFVFIALMLVSSLLRRVLRRGPYPAELLIREIRASFYRKLFIAFVAATLVPVLALALLVRAYVANQLRDDVEAEAARTALTAKRVIEESLALQQRETTANASSLSDDVMVWISRVIDQDVNIFEGPKLFVTSERDLFASGLLPIRTPDAVYRAVVLERLPTYVGQDRIGDFTYLVAATPVRVEGRDATLTVPLASRQREIEQEIDELDRGVLLGALVLILLGSGLGYWMAERIGDPVQRLTRASRQIAAGDLGARVIVRTADELQRLVEAFNRMAGELQRQRQQLERTHRLEAWAEMARQVAHDIKNPLTPIQLSAEHLRRVHQDRGAPLSPVLDNCVDTILTQVRLLRQIASEFSSFGSSPTARPAPTAIGELLREAVDPYRLGAGDRLAFTIDLAPDLPLVSVDRMLIGRAITNVIENALHAMPGGGALVVTADREDDRLVVRIRDTGVGMDAAAAERIFEPYFSTKATGTGLGLSIARRNVELHGGTIVVDSTRGAGTTVTIRLPVVSRG